MRRATSLISVVAMLIVTPSALASGGLDSGGSGGGGGGGGGGGTTTTTTTTTAPASCATITGFSNSTGYYSVFAAIWTQFSVSDACGYPVNWKMTYVNGNTGNLDFSAGTSTQYESSGTVDEDWAAFSTPYTVSLTVTDPYSGAVLASQSALVTTKAPKSTTGG
jgi:hypothetical protein